MSIKLSNTIKCGFSPCTSSNESTSSSKSDKDGAASNDQKIWLEPLLIASLANCASDDKSFSDSSWLLPVSIENKRILIVCAPVSAEMYKVGTFIQVANAKASVDLPAPGAPANILTSLLRKTIWAYSNVLNTGGNGSPPDSVLPIVLVSVLTYATQPTSPRLIHIG